MKKIISSISFKAGGDGGVKIGYSNYDEDGLIGTTDKDYKRVPNPVFKEAMQKLKTHLIFILEFSDAKKYSKYKEFAEDDVVAKDFRVTGFHVSGDGAKESIILSGFRTLSTGLGHSINTPNTRVESDGDTAYKFMNELLATIEEVRMNAGEYLAGKHSVRQGKLALADGEEGQVVPIGVGKTG
jgi:hypothetical protein